MYVCMYVCMYICIFAKEVMEEVRQRKDSDWSLYDLMWIYQESCKIIIYP